MYSPHAPNTAALIEAIWKMPNGWALTPCRGKENMWKGWNKEHLDRATMCEAIRSQVNADGKHTAWTGVSIVTGPLSGGIMAVDFDGPLALDKYVELNPEKKLPPTTKRWTSGKKGHHQILLSVPPDKWEGLTHKMIELEDGQKLELRWNQCSTLPPSIHPDTGKPYIWKNEGEIAECPDFILQLMTQTPPVALSQPEKARNTQYIDSEQSLVDLLENTILRRLDAEEFYGNWVALKKSGDSLKGLCPFHQEKTGSFTVSPTEKLFKCFGCGAGGGPVQFLHQIKGGTGSPTGKEFYEVVMELAGKVGVQIPDNRQQRQSQNPKSNTHKTNNQPSNVLTHPKFEIPDAATLESEIEKLFTLDLKRSQLQIKVSELAKTYRLPSSEIWKIYREQEREQEQEDNQENIKIGIEQLLASQFVNVKLTDLFPKSLAAPIEEVARRMNLKPECYALALITGTSRFIKNGSSTMLVEEWNRYRCRTYGYFGVMIAESSQMKTPVLNAMITDPLARLRERGHAKYEAEKETYTEAMEQWKNSKDEDKGPPPEAPVEKIPYITKATWEGVAGMVGRDPIQGILWISDELAGFFKSANQYRSGKGSDKEDLLEAWSGNGAVIARAAGTTVNVGAVSLSIYGNIQPRVLAPFLGDGSDDNGTIARFEFVQQPPALTQITLGLSKIDINPMLETLYERMDTIPVTEFALDEEGKKLFVDYYNHCQRLRLSHPKQGMRAMLGKAAEKVGRVATILHCIHAAHLGIELSPQIPASQVAAAIKWVEYTTQQALSINIEVCEPDALEGNLAKIILLAQQKNRPITVREVQHGFHSKHRPSAQNIKEWFFELQQMRYGTVAASGKSYSFTLSPTPTEPTHKSNVDSVNNKGSHTSVGGCGNVPTDLEKSVGTVGSCGRTPPTPQSLTNNGLQATVGTVGGFSISQNPPIAENVTENNFNPESVARFKEWGDQFSENYKNLSELAAEYANEPTVPTNTIQSQRVHSFEPVGDPPTPAHSSHSGLNEDETELLEYLQKAVAENDPYFAQQVRGILTEVCKAGAADRKKVWGALGDAEQKTFTELLAVEIPVEVGHVIEAIQQILPAEDPNEVDHLYRVFAPELIDRAIELLRPADKTTILHWIAIRKLAIDLIEAIFDGAVADVAAAHPADLVELAIVRLEYLKEWEAVDEIRDALS